MRTSNHNHRRTLALAATGTALFLAVASARPAEACVDDNDCKGDRVCDRRVCVTPRAAAPERPSAPPPLVMIEPMPRALSLLAPPAAPPPAPPVSASVAPLAVPPEAPPAVPAAPQAAAPAITETLPTAAPGQRSDSAYDPSLGFRCVFGPTTCSFQLRPLAVDWSHADLHGDVLLGGLEGGDLGLGVGTRHWKLGAGANSFGMVFRWDDDVVVARATPSGDTILAVGLETGPKLGFSYAISRDLALEADLNGGLFFGYGFALNGGVDQSMVDGFMGLLVGARM